MDFARKFLPDRERSPVRDRGLWVDEHYAQIFHRVQTPREIDSLRHGGGSGRFTVLGSC